MAFKDIFTNRVWALDTRGFSFWKRRLVRFVKLVRITVDTFAENRIGFQCVALSYFVALAIIPFAAFIFAVSGGMGLSDRISDMLYNAFPMATDAVNLILERASNIIDSAKSSAVGFISALLFLWTILWLFFQTERVFNNIWGIRKIPRKMYKRFSSYILILFLSPFMILIFGVGIAAYSNLTKLIGIDFGDLTFMPKLISWTIFYVITSLTLSAMYKFIPATEVKYINALKAAAFAAVFFIIFQYFYLSTQLFVSRINGVYGAIAAIPLFLIWMNFSWQIIMYGAELCYGYQNVDSYHIPEWENEEDK